MMPNERREELRQIALRETACGCYWPAELLAEVDRLWRLEARVKDDELCKVVLNQTRTSCVLSRMALYHYRAALNAAKENDNG